VAGEGLFIVISSKKNHVGRSPMPNISKRKKRGHPNIGLLNSHYSHRFQTRNRVGRRKKKNKKKRKIRDKRICFRKTRKFRKEKKKKN